MVINASWGDYSSSPYNDIFRDDGDSARWNALHDAITAARDAPNTGIIFVAACGNNGHDNDSHPLYPASYTDLDNIIAVAATDENDALAVCQRGRRKPTDYAIEEVLILVEMHDVIARGGVRQNVVPRFAVT